MRILLIMSAFYWMTRRLLPIDYAALRLDFPYLFFHQCINRDWSLLHLFETSAKPGFRSSETPCLTLPQYQGQNPIACRLLYSIPLGRIPIPARVPRTALFWAKLGFTEHPKPPPISYSIAVSRLAPMR